MIDIVCTFLIADKCEFSRENKPQKPTGPKKTRANLYIRVHRARFKNFSPLRYFSGALIE